jgi:predicted DNA-binding protein
MRAVDLALFADELAARAATLAAQLERARGHLRRAAIEKEARRALDDGLVARLEALEVLRAGDTQSARTEIGELSAALQAVEELQAWVEARLFAAREEISAA